MENQTGERNYHHWTPAEFELCRRYYDGHKESIDYLQTLIPTTHQGIKQKAIALHLTKRQKPPNWTPEELDELARLTPIWSVPRIARKMHRTENAIRAVQWKKSISPLNREWFTQAEIVQILNVNGQTVQKWVKTGILHTSKEGPRDAYLRITTKDLYSLVVNHPGELQGRKVDMVFLVDLLSNYRANANDGITNKGAKKITRYNAKRGELFEEPIQSYLEELLYF